MQMLYPTLMLIGIILVMYAASRWARRHLGIAGTTITPNSLKVVGKRSLDQKTSLYLVEVGERYILVGAGEGSANLIDHVSDDEFRSMTDTPDETTATRAQGSSGTRPQTAPSDLFGRLLGGAKRFHELRAKQSDDGVVDLDVTMPTR